MGALAVRRRSRWLAGFAFACLAALVLTAACTSFDAGETNPTTDPSSDGSIPSDATPAGDASDAGGQADVVGAFACPPGTTLFRHDFDSPDLNSWFQQTGEPPCVGETGVTFQSGPVGIGQVASIRCESNGIGAFYVLSSKHLVDANKPFRAEFSVKVEPNTGAPPAYVFGQVIGFFGANDNLAFVTHTSPSVIEAVRISTGLLLYQWQKAMDWAVVTIDLTPPSPFNSQWQAVLGYAGSKSTPLPFDNPAAPSSRTLQLGPYHPFATGITAVAYDNAMYCQ